MVILVIHLYFLRLCADIIINWNFLDNQFVVLHKTKQFLGTYLSHTTRELNLGRNSQNFLGKFERFIKFKVLLQSSYS